MYQANKVFKIINKADIQPEWFGYFAYGLSCPRESVDKTMLLLKFNEAPEGLDCITAIEANIRLLTIEWVGKDFTNNDEQLRVGNIIQLMDVAKDSILEIPYLQFLADAEDEVIDYIKNNSTNLVSKVTDSELDFWYMRADEESPTPREYALNLLN